MAPPKEEDLEEGAKVPRDEHGKVWKYTCHLQPCTKRQLGYKELVLHLATQHQLLREVMARDARPGAAAALALLYPEDRVEKVAVKVEKVDRKVVEKVGGKVVERAEEEVSSLSEAIFRPWAVAEEEAPVSHPEAVQLAAEGDQALPVLQGLVYLQERRLRRLPPQLLVLLTSRFLVAAVLSALLCPGCTLPNSLGSLHANTKLLSSLYLLRAVVPARQKTALQQLAPSPT